ncbi:MAG: hypothetical protein Q8O55_03725 [Dehalococcoidales bacterium]|nr:hypothetical protein [Dehalococcoidales bacterium]
MAIGTGIRLEERYSTITSQPYRTGTPYRCFVILAMQEAAAKLE